MVSRLEPLSFPGAGTPHTLDGGITPSLLITRRGAGPGPTARCMHIHTRFPAMQDRRLNNIELWRAPPGSVKPSGPDAVFEKNITKAREGSQSVKATMRLPKSRSRRD